MPNCLLVSVSLHFENFGDLDLMNNQPRASAKAGHGSRHAKHLLHPGGPWIGRGNNITDPHAILYQMDHHVLDGSTLFYLVAAVYKWEV